MSTLRLVHTADVHLGRSSQEFGATAAAHRWRLLEAFERCAGLCRERDANLFIIAGDLFDSPRPPESTAQRVEAALRELGGGSPAVSVVLIPGTHDPLEPGSIYQRWSAEGLPAGVHLLTSDQPSVNLPELDVTCSFAVDLEKLEPDAAARFNIGIVHGSVNIPGLIDEDDVIFSEAEIAATGVDYLALGHWHSFADYSQDEVVALYPGSPEIVALQQAVRGQALVVELTEAGQISWERVVTGTLQYRQHEFDLADLRDSEELRQRLLELADANTILDARLTGIAPPGLVLDPDELREEVADQFFRLQLTDESHADWQEADGEPQGLVAERFQQLLKQRLEEADSDEERRIIERARSLGLALLAGREVLR